MGLHGITVILIQKVKVGKDAFNKDVYTEVPVEVKNVLVSPSSAEEQKDALELYNRKVLYTLAIPKTDTHTWEGQRVSIWGDTYEVVGIPTKGIDDLIPGPWNTKVRVARYE